MSWLRRAASAAARAAASVRGEWRAAARAGGSSSTPVQHRTPSALFLRNGGGGRPALCAAAGAVRFFHEAELPPVKPASADPWAEHSVGIPEKDMKAIQAAFDLIDLDENGVIDREEQASLELILVDAGFSPQDVGRAIKEMDADGNGEISREEFVHWWTKNDMHSRSKKIRESFREFWRGDGQGDDKLD